MVRTTDGVRIGVLGTGMVGRTLAGSLVALGHEVMMGSRQAGNANAVAWAAQAGPSAREGSFADAAGFGMIVVNATAGAASLGALAAAGADALAGKVLLDVANPLDHAPGATGVLTVCNTDSLGEQIQRAFPDTRVVKALNTMSAEVMVKPRLVPGSHNVFLCGEDAEAKVEVAGLLEAFGWPAADIVDLGGISAARGTEMYLALWLGLWGVAGTGRLNVRLITREIADEALRS